MPDSRKHRGAHPEDPQLFSPEWLPTLRSAVEELSWLLTREYPAKAALKLVGDRHRLNERQRMAVNRCACSDASRAHRARTRVERVDRPLEIDGFNLLITVEAALSGGSILRGRDGCLRDLASIHGTYRSVEETDGAIRLVGAALARLGAPSARWWLDSPISNSGRLAGKLRQVADECGWPWTVETVFNPDRELISSAGLVVSSHSVVLDGVDRWLDLLPEVLGRLPRLWLIDLGRPDPGT